MIHPPRVLARINVVYSAIHSEDKSFSDKSLIFLSFDPCRIDKFTWPVKYTCKLYLYSFYNTHINLEFYEDENLYQIGLKAIFNFTIFLCAKSGLNWWGSGVLVVCERRPKFENVASLGKVASVARPSMFLHCHKRSFSSSSKTSNSFSRAFGEEVRRSIWPICVKFAGLLHRSSE